jgi:uncharacterized protein with GYD domain
MSKYVALLNWTDKGIAEASDSVQRADRAKAFAQSLGGSMETILWTLGEYDIVAIFDMPDDASMAAVAAKAAATGHIRSRTMRAFTADELGGIIDKLG